MTSLADQFEALKPCPFCGNQPFLTGHERHPAWWHVKCLHCQKVISQTNRLRTKAEAIAAWNNRTAISSALTSAPPVQEGWVTVPREPTLAMWDAGCDALDGDRFDIDACYRAMISAAPEPTPTGEMG